MTSVLDQMIAGTTQRKQDKAVQLTPVGTEKGGPLATPGLIPLDVPGTLLAREGLLDVAADLRRQADYLIAVATGIEVMAGVAGPVQSASAHALDTERKLMEQEADRKAADRAKAEDGDKRAAARVADVTPETEAAEQESFAARMARLSAEAQAAVFAENDAAAPDPEPVVAASGSPIVGWTCPTHGDDNIKELTSRKGRKYRACQTCTEFEK